MWLLDKLLTRLISRGEFEIIDANGRNWRYGLPDPELEPVRLRFTDGKVPFDIVRDPALGTAEAYMDGRLEFEAGEVLDLVEIFRLNSRWEEKGPKPGWKRQSGKLLARLDRFNWPQRSKRNVAHHYDLGNRLYELFLDRDMQYSCAYFTRDMQYSCAYFTDAGNSLEEAQEDKKAHIAAKLHLKPGQRVLDIGCGWGGMALYLHRVADVDVLGITLSEEQFKKARQRAEAAGVAERVNFELIDYRHVEGRFDRIVSVGMFEHVGPPHYRTFFRKCRNLLTEDGVMLLHTIGRMGPPGTTDRFTSKYIFPGGYIPALSEVVTASEQARLVVTDAETLRLHYYHTILHWYERTKKAEREIVDMYDERFYRLWLFYLAGAGTAFKAGGMVNHQIQYVRDRTALPITRDYMSEAERVFRSR